MRLVSFTNADTPLAGVQLGSLVYNTGASMAELLDGWPHSFDRLPRSIADVTDNDRLIAAAEINFSAPIPNPSKVIGVGMNYVDHCREQGIDPPQRPTLFAKFPSSVVGPGAFVEWPATLTEQVDWEVELAVVIGKRGRGISRQRAGDFIAGYTICNDISARDIQFGDGQFVRGKSLDTFCPLGPALVTGDEVGDPGRLWLRLELNGTLMQESTTANLIFDVFELVEFCSESFTLLPGDVIVTGTPAGVGCFRKPPVFLKAGDRMVASIEKLGSLITPVAGPQ
jgi:2-keto-4-pentenoate hydratase/2-oxohepta-3-ene-1,7-dioic acid hydratase in catechol pathway